MRRVLKPGGVVGIREEDVGSQVIYPEVPFLKEAFEIYLQYWRHNGGDPYLPRRYKEILRESGFSNIQITASAHLWATPEETSQWGNFASRHVLEPIFIDTVVEQGIADRDQVYKISEAFKAWGEHPDAIMIQALCEGVGWKE